MRSQKGIGLVQLVLVVIVLMILTGVATYVVMGDNGVMEKEMQKSNSNTVNEINM